MKIQIALLPCIMLILLYLALLRCSKNAQKLVMQSSMEDTKEALNSCSIVALLAGLSNLILLCLISSADFSIQTAPVIQEAGTATTIRNDLTYYAPWWFRGWLYLILTFSCIVFGLELDGLTAWKGYSYKTRCIGISRLCRCNMIYVDFTVILLLVIRNVISYRTSEFFGLTAEKISLFIHDTDALIPWLAVSVALPCCILIIRRIQRLRRQRKTTT